jgi:hypothetical protein
MRLSQSHESSQGFDKLNQVDPSLIFCLLLIDFFFNFIIECWIDYELSFMICFDLFSMWLSRFHDRRLSE